MNKLVLLDDMAGQIPDGATVAIGGSSISRKPMAMVRALARSGVKDLRLIVDVGGPDVDLLIGVGAVREVLYAFVGFEFLGLAPHFRAARQNQSVAFQEWTEYTIMAGLDATIKRIPFIPTHAGLATDVLSVNPAFRVIADPFGGDDVVAIPPLSPDFALIHANYADRAGNGVILGDSHVDVLCAKAAKTTFLSCEQVLSSKDLQNLGAGIQILRIHTAGVIEAPWGAHPTIMAPGYRLDLGAMKDYLHQASDPDLWLNYTQEVIGQDHETYVKHQGGALALKQRLGVSST
ncbi:MAG: CoA transferase subunit A [Firmicutes bacterium]|jgi:glutaconate CoA-transferase subunit A|nr:CoA transferase subunit A [Bacillota bacterium]MCL5063605.1 CoA transferase subunit A [Bacillota bacterium]